MEVKGRTDNSHTDTTTYCKPCGDDTKRVPANGLCRDCEEHMCIACFENHKKYKMCKDHVLLDINAEIKATDDTVKKDDDYEECALHDCESVKFYCPKHDQVACGDCIILKHKTCDVKYIRDMISTLKDRKQGDEIVQHLQHCQTEAELCSISIQESKNQIEDINIGFLAEIRSLRHEINEHFDELEKPLIQKANDLKSRDEKHISALENECEDIAKDLSRMNNALDTQSDDAKKRFVSAVHNRHALKEIDQKLRYINTGNKTNIYRFYGDEPLRRILTECKEIGNLQIIVSNDMDANCYQPPGISHDVSESNDEHIPASQSKEPATHHRSIHTGTDVNCYRSSRAMEQLTESDADYVLASHCKGPDIPQRKISNYTNVNINKPSSDVQKVNASDFDYSLGKHREEHGSIQSSVSAYTDMNHYKPPGSVKKVNDSPSDYMVTNQCKEVITKQKNDVDSEYSSLDNKYIDTENVYSDLDCTLTATRYEQEGNVTVGTKQEYIVNSPELKQANAVKLPIRASRKGKHWNLFEYQLRCENVLTAGEYMSYKENEGGDVGLYVAKKAVKTGSYFEIEIICTGDKGNIAIGYVPKDYALNQQPGVGHFSIGYHANNGCVYDQSDGGKRIGPSCATGDRMGIGVSSLLSTVFQTKVDIFFTRNGKQIGELELKSPSFCKIYPAIGMQSVGEKLRTFMDAKVPQESFRFTSDVGTQNLRSSSNLQIYPSQIK